MLLTIKKRQTYLKELGFYDGIIDGKEGKKTKEAYLKLQKKYFTKRKSDIDGIYGKNTDILLKSAYNFKNANHFKLEEFKCKCEKSCTGYPVILSEKLVINLENLRNYLQKPITIKSGERCEKHNKAVGGDSTSKHKKGWASDIYVQNYSNLATNRKKLVNYWTGNLKQFHAYCNGYRVRGGKTTYPIKPSMGSSVHVEIKE